MPIVVYRRKALADIENACAFSERKWGPAQRARYEEIIAEAVGLLADNPQIGRPRAELDPAARSLFIARPGKNASHILYYFIGDDGSVYIVRMLHAAQDPVLNLGDDPWPST